MYHKPAVCIVNSTVQVDLYKRFYNNHISHRFVSSQSIWQKMKDIPDAKKTTRINLDFEALKKSISLVQSRVHVVNEARMSIHEILIHRMRLLKCGILYGIVLVHI